MNQMPDPNARGFLAYLLNVTHDAVTMIDTECTVIGWNEAAAKYYGIPQQKILGRKIQEFFREEDLMVLKVLKTRQPVFSLYHTPQPNTHVIINSTPVYDDQGQLIGAISLEQDVSQIVRLNEELSETSMELDKLKKEMTGAAEEDPFFHIKGHSEPIRQSIEMAKKVAGTDATILITGESGVGKEVFARAIHKSSRRREHPFVPINCGAIPAALFESELFGYEEGAFTGANKKGKAGKLELADGGTLFLDEVGDLPFDMQVKLLRVLQEQVFYRVGGTTPREINVRIIAATNQNLEEKIQRGAFREDLFYRLNVISLKLPALRQRSEDIPELVQVFLREFADKYEKPIPILNSDVMLAFLNYDWPGNIRQLRNVIERLTILSDTGHITMQDVPEFLYPESGQALQLDTLHSEKERLEQERIRQALKETYGNKSAAARKLGISRASLYQKIKKYRLEDPKNDGGDVPFSNR
ncbi:MAG: sigma 54-interacting transcriptional regulator [Bacillaceae bacterium]|nr:sigma 54-interacting transcriptional regulator [Bacillaceae bacterium]